jgi:hypothetical protein
MYDLKIRQMCERIICKVTSIPQFAQAFEEDIKLIPSMSAYSPAGSYRLVPKDFYMQVCHRNTEGKIDRVLLEVFDIREEWESC